MFGPKTASLTCTNGRADPLSLSAHPWSSFALGAWRAHRGGASESRMSEEAGGGGCERGGMGAAADGGGGGGRRVLGGGGMGTGLQLH